MKKLAIMTAAVVMSATAANADVISNAQGAYDNAADAYNALGGNVIGSSGGNAFNALLDEIATQEPGYANQASPLTTTTTISSFAGITITAPIPTVVTVPVRRPVDVQAEADATVDALLDDFIGGRDRSGFDNSLVGQAIGRVETAATNYANADWNTMTEQEAIAAVNTYNAVASGELTNINTASAKVQNLTDTFAASNHANLIAGQFDVTASDAVVASEGLTVSFSSRLNKLAGSYTTETFTFQSGSVTVPTGWTVIAGSAPDSVRIIQGANSTLNITLGGDSVQDVVDRLAASAT